MERASLERETILQTFSERMEKARNTLRITKSDLAAMSGVSKQAISFYESKDPKNRRAPTVENAAKIAEALGVTVDWLCGLNDQYGRAFDSLDYGIMAQQWISFSEFCRAKSAFTDRADPSDGLVITEGQCSLVTHDPVLVKFLGDWLHMKTLFDNGVISEGIFNDWLDASMRKLSAIQMMEEEAVDAEKE